MFYFTPKFLSLVSAICIQYHAILVNIVYSDVPEFHDRVY